LSSSFLTANSALSLLNLARYLPDRPVAQLAACSEKRWRLHCETIPAEGGAMD
jgi:hypothetical protein